MENDDAILMKKRIKATIFYDQNLLGESNKKKNSIKKF